MPRRRGGKRHTMLMMFVGGVVSVIDGIPVLFLQQKTYGAGVFRSRPNPYSCIPVKLRTTFCPKLMAIACLQSNQQKLISTQESHLRLSAPHQSPEKRVTGLIAQLLQVVHAQWIYWCFLVHDCTSGMLINLHKTELLEEIANQLSMGLDNLMEDDKYLS